jgi:GntR family transcriptional regulator, arabinose operon transcriptional repressor
MKYEVDRNSALPRYYQVYSSLQERIKAGEFKADEALPPERQLVKDYGVSRITIVKALDTLESEGFIRREHGRGTFVNAQPSVAAEETPTIAFISGVMVHPYIYSVLMGTARAAAEKHYSLYMIGLHTEEVDDQFALEQATAKNVAGVVIYPRPGEKDYSLCQKILERGIPLVMVDRYYKSMENDYIIFDEEVASYQLTKYMIERGHKNIALLTHYEVEASSIHNRIRGYRRALEEHDLYQDDLLWFDVYAGLHISKGQIGNEKMTRKLRERLENSNATALLAVNHDIAERLNYDLMLINAERTRENFTQDGDQVYEIPVEIAAFGHRSLADFSTYNIVTALQVGEDLGTQAIDLLHRRLSGDSSDFPAHIHVPIQIIFPKPTSLDKRSNGRISNTSESE